MSRFCGATEQSSSSSTHPVSELASLNIFLEKQGIRRTDGLGVTINGAPVGHSYARPGCDGELFAVAIDRNGDSRFLLDRIQDPVMSGRRYLFEGRFFSTYPWTRVWRRDFSRRFRSVLNADWFDRWSPVIAVSETGQCGMNDSIPWKKLWRMNATNGESL